MCHRTKLLVTVVDLTNSQSVQDPNNSQRLYITKEEVEREVEQEREKEKKYQRIGLIGIMQGG